MKTDKLVEQFERAYRAEKLKEAEELHNALTQVLTEHKAELQTIIYVFEMIRFELLKEKYQQLFESK